MNRRMAMTLLTVGLIMFIGLAVIIPFARSGGSRSADDSSSFVPFIPIWFAAIIPILVKKQEQNEAREKIKRKLNNSDRYLMMRNLVNELNDVELRYIKQRLLHRSQHRASG